MALKGWAELVQEQVAQWIREDGIDEDVAKRLWGSSLGEDLDGVIAEQVKKHEQEWIEADRMHRYEYEVINIEGNQNAKEIINAYAKEGWRLHTFSLTALDAGAFMGGWMKAFGGPGVAFTNVLTLVFERDRRSN